MKKRTRAKFDDRLLKHHPAGKACFDVCLANGWFPTSGDVVRLVRLWDEVHSGTRSEVALSVAHLEFARWLRQTGRIGEDVVSDR
jgi:hypothetical protein